MGEGRLAFACTFQRLASSSRRASEETGKCAQPAGMQSFRSCLGINTEFWVCELLPGGIKVARGRVSEVASEDALARKLFECSRDNKHFCLSPDSMEFWQIQRFEFLRASSIYQLGFRRGTGESLREQMIWEQCNHHISIETVQYLYHTPNLAITNYISI